MEKITYYLFGEDACIELKTGGVEEVLKAFDRGELTYTTFAYDERENESFDILNAYNGWNDFSIISKEEYEQL